MPRRPSTDSPEAREESGYYGKYRGLVEENDDPKNMGRLKAKVPELLGDEVTGWALPCVPYAGDGSGQYTIPEPDTGVWIEFEGGDLSRPIWTGCWWGKDELPEDEGGSSGEPSTRILRSEEGLMVSLDDDGKKIRVSDENGNNLLEIATQSGKVTVEASSKVVVEAPQIELVKNASHPVVFGDELMTHLTEMMANYQAHTHPGQTVMGIPVTPAPPVPALPAPTPSLISTKVKSG